MLRSGYRGTKMLALTTMLAFGLVACGDDGDDDADQSAQTTVAAPQGSPLVTINLIDHAFQVSGPLTAGGTLRLVNMGTEFHMLGIGKLKPGKTMADVQKALSESGPPGGGGEGAPSTTAAAGGTGQSTTTAARGATTTTARGAATTAGGRRPP